MTKSIIECREFQQICLEDPNWKYLQASPIVVDEGKLMKVEELEGK